MMSCLVPGDACGAGFSIVQMFIVCISYFGFLSPLELVEKVVKFDVIRCTYVEQPLEGGRIKP